MTHETAAANRGAPTLAKVRCARCCGSGRYSFNLISGDKCFGCGGKGYVWADPAKLARNQKARECRAAKSKVNRDARVALGAEMAAERERKYKDDPRLGPKTRARCAQFEAVAFDVYRMLDAADTGGNVHQSAINRLSE